MNIVHNNSQMEILNTSVTKSLPSTPTSALSKRVVRNLFGHPDPRSSFARDKVKEIKEQQKEKWNFDFDQETPLAGRFQWEPVPLESSSVEVPKAYACERLPFIASASSSSTSTAIATTPNSSSRNIEPRNLYYTPTTPKKSHRDDRTPLLIVREHPASLSKTVDTPSASTATTTAEPEGSKNDQSTSSKIATNDDVICNPPPPVNSVASSSSRSSLPTPEDSSSQSEETSISKESHVKKEDLECKVQVKSSKQTLIDDYMRKRKAPQSTITGNKKAAK